MEKSPLGLVPDTTEANWSKKKKKKKKKKKQPNKQTKKKPKKPQAAKFDSS